MMIDVVTIFPDLFTSPLSHGVVAIAQKRRLVEVRVHDLRDYTSDRHRTTDDYPYGGGPGMVMKVEPLVRSIESIQAEVGRCCVILMTPQGRVFTQRIAGELSREERLLILCGRYRGVDDRLRSRYINDEISIGDYVLSGGELPSLVLIEAVVRQVPGVLGNEMSAAGDSFASSLLEGPVFTRPFDFRRDTVPEVLVSGNAAKIQRWCRKEMLRRTLERRPDLLKDTELSEEDQTLFDELNCERPRREDRGS